MFFRLTNYALSRGVGLGERPGRGICEMIFPTWRPGQGLLKPAPQALRPFATPSYAAPSGLDGLTAAIDNTLAAASAALPPAAAPAVPFSLSSQHPPPPPPEIESAVGTPTRQRELLSAVSGALQAASSPEHIKILSDLYVRVASDTAAEPF